MLFKLKDKTFWYTSIVIVLIVVTMTGIVNLYIGKMDFDKAKDPGITHIEKQYIIDIQNRIGESPSKVIEEFEKKKDELLSKQLNDKEKLELGQAYFFLALANINNNTLDESIEYFNKTIEHFNSSNNFFYITNSYNYLAKIYYTRLDFIKALEVANELYNIVERKEIKGVNIEGQDVFRTNVLSILVVTTLNLNINDVNEEFYHSLVKLTNTKVELNTDMAIYAKYEYNLKKGSIEDAKKYAMQYYDYLKQLEVPGNETADAAYIYLAECYILNKEFEKVPELIEKVESAHNKLNSTPLDATLNNVKGTYYVGIGDYYTALEYLEKSLEQFESIDYDYYSYSLAKKILMLVRDHNLDVDVNYYIDTYLKMEEKGASTKTIGEVANNLINTIDELSDVKNSENKTQKELLLKINNIAKKMNLIFVITIIILIGILYKFRIVINDKVNKEELLKEMVNTDYLTKASSKQYTYQRVNEYISKGKEFYATMIDIDHFKKINDTYGHMFGDEVLVVLVRVIKESIKDNGFVGRYGGEEFIIIVDNMSLDINELINSIAKEIQEIKWRYPELKVTISGGTVKNNSKDIDELMLITDELLYESKKVRNKITTTVE